MGATARSLVIALRTDASGLSEGFQQAQAQTKQFTQEIIDAQAKLKEIRGAPADTEADKQAKREAIEMQRQEIAQIREKQIAAANMAVLERDQERMRAELLDSRVQKQIEAEQQIRAGSIQSQEQMMGGLRAQEEMHAELLDARVRAEFAANDEIVQSAEAMQAKLDALERRRDQIEDLASAGVRQQFGTSDPFGSEEGGGGRHAMGEGWMRRMAAMDITRDVGNMIVPGLGDQTGMAGYFAAGGGVAMVGIGSAVAALTVAAREVQDIRDGIKATKEAQVEFNAETDKTNVKWEMLAENTRKFGQLGQEARSQFESGSTDFISARAAEQKAQIQVDSDFFPNHVDEAQLRASLLTEKQKKEVMELSKANLYGMDAVNSSYWSTLPGQNLQAITGGFSVTDIENQRSQQDITASEDASDRMLKAAGIHPGPLASFQMRQAEIANAEITADLKYGRDREDAKRTIGISFMQQHTGDKSYRVEDDPAYQAQLQATNRWLEAEHEKTTDLLMEEEKRAEITRDFEQQDFDRQQQNELRLAQIHGTADPLRREIDEQMELNKQNIEKLQTEKRTTDEIERQKQLGDQILQNIRERTERERSNEILGVLDKVDVARGHLSNLQAERQSYEREHPDSTMGVMRDEQQQIIAATMRGDMGEVMRLQAQMAQTGANIDYLNNLFRAKKGEVDADFYRSIQGKEIDILAQRGLINPQEADYDRLRIANPDVNDKLLRLMASLDRIGSGTISTEFTAGMTDFGALHGVMGGGGPSWGSNAFSASSAKDMAMFNNRGLDAAFGEGGPMSVFDGGSLITSSNPMISSSNPMIASRSSAVGSARLESDNPQMQLVALVREVRNLVRTIRDNAAN